MTFLAPFIMGGGDGRLFRAPYLGPSFYPEYVPYAGVISVTLVVLALLFSRDKRTWFWAAVVVGGLVLAFGRYAPLSLNALTYYVPVLNLFRVPARHLMEVHFAVAVLAGRGLTSLQLLRGNKGTIPISVIVAFAVLILAYLIVTVFRPSDFHLSRNAPVTILRAPELFMPLVMAAISGFAIWWFATKRKGASLLLFGVLVIDLFIWGQFSGWFTSSRRIPEEYWSVPESVSLIRKNAPADASSYRILTTHIAFDPEVSTANANPGWVLWTEPDIYLMHGIHNAAGYDGFSVRRYSELAGQMKPWGELTDPNATLRSDSRELDILNVRYLVARRERPIPREDDELGVDELKASESAFAAASEQYGAYMFTKDDLALSDIGPGKRLRFRVPPVNADRLALITNLSFAERVPDNAVIGRLRLRAADGGTFEYSLRAGTDTADWAYDRPDIRSRIQHQRATIASSYDVSDAQYKYQGHRYLTSIVLPGRVVIESGELDVDPLNEWSGSFLTVFRMSLADASDGKSYPLPRRMITTVSSGANGRGDENARWKFVASGLDVNIYENTRGLPRAWLAPEFRVLDEQAILHTIRTGVLPDGSKWDPLRTALVEAEPSSGLKSSGQTGSVEVTKYEPNRLNLQTRASADAVLVLSENDYPGWRAYIDGEPASIIRVNYGLRGVAVPGGEHQITFVYRPWSVMGGALISIVTAALLIVFCVFERRGKSRV